MKPFAGPDLWEYLAETEKNVVMYGMGNGADKILEICARKNIPVRDFFASDGFVRGQAFHGKQVLSYDDVRKKYGVENLIVLLSFGSSRPEVLETIQRIAGETELYAPDVPVFGDGLFDRSFYNAHREELKKSRELLSDNLSRRILDQVLRYKLTGEIRFLSDAVSDEAEDLRTLILSRNLHTVADLGAYNGDTVRDLLSCATIPPQCVYAVEPDERNFRKLTAYAEGESRTRVIPICAAAWDRREILSFDADGNRNAAVDRNRSSALFARPAKVRTVCADTVDGILAGKTVDYIKYDVEGSEREAILGSTETILRSMPALAVSLYHRNEDLFALPLLIQERFSAYRGFYLRRRPGVPAWDLILYVLSDEIETGRETPICGKAFESF